MTASPKAESLLASLLRRGAWLRGGRAELQVLAWAACVSRVALSMAVSHGRGPRVMRSVAVLLTVEEIDALGEAWQAAAAERLGVEWRSKHKPSRSALTANELAAFEKHLARG